LAEPESDSHELRRKALVESFSREGEVQITYKRVIEAMRATLRHRFVPEELQAKAYEDRPLPIGHDQTISQPSLVAFMTQELKPQAKDRVLEIGTGSGYQAAVLSPLVAEVYSIEIVKPLAERAAKTLTELGYKNVHTRAGNGWLGWPEAAPFDAIIVTCAPDAIPPALVEQLREGGRMVIPVGPENRVQELYLLEKRTGKIEQRSILPVRFVPMTGKEIKEQDLPSPGSK
jgi:protein-L-isoaspartate(D-aspartate) O-methyltransferase